jgi:hypothetical protein
LLANVVDAYEEGAPRGVVLDERLGSGNLVHDYIIVGRSDCALELRVLASRHYDERVVLGADAFAYLQRDPDALAADPRSARRVRTCETHEVHPFVGGAVRSGGRGGSGGMPIPWIA